jgi:hypothetical protein
MSLREENNKLYFVYKVTNKRNNRYYIGAHETYDISDGYLGSGIAIKRAIRKHGAENFIREILVYSQNETEMYLLEEQILGDKWNTDPLCYNVMPGGTGSWKHVNDSGMHKGANNCMHNEEVKTKVINKMKVTKASNKEKYYKIAKNAWIISANKTRGKKRSDHSKAMKLKMKEVWQRNGMREKIRDSISGMFEIYKPNGEIFITNRLCDVCKEYNLPFVSMWNSAKDNCRVLTKGRAKGWKCKQI